MDENLRKPTIGEAPPIISQPELALVKDEGGKTEEPKSEESQAAVSAPIPMEQPQTVEEKTEETVQAKPVVKKKRRGRKKKAVKPKQMELTKLELAMLDLNQARVDMQSTVLQNLQMKEKILSGEYAQQRDHLRRKQRDTVISMETCKEEYNQTREEIQQRLGISLDACTIRQDGVVIPIDKDGNPEYMGDGG